MFGVFIDPPPDPVSEVLDLIEDGGGLMGFWMRGHVDRWAFAEAVNRHTGAAEGYDIRYCYAAKPYNSRGYLWGTIADVRVPRHVWWRTMPTGEDGNVVFHPAVPRTRGAFKATVFEWGSWLGRERARMYDEIRRTRVVAFADGVNWAAGATGDDAATKRIIETYRASQTEIENVVSDKAGW